MILTPKTFLIVCPMLFLAGFVDAIGGGGGLISLPAYLFAGLPIHAAIATNKLSSMVGTAASTARFAKNRLINWKLSIPAVLFAVLGSSLGARISLSMDEQIMRYILFAVLPVAAFFVLHRRFFPDDSDSEQLTPNYRTYLTASIAAFLIGMYDGLYGPGTGTFLIITFTVFAKLGVQRANA